MDFILILIISSALLLLGTTVFFVSCLKKCPSNKLLVIYGKLHGDAAFRCIHRGLTFVWPIIQKYQWLDLSPITFNTNAEVIPHLTITLAISNEPEIRKNAAERLLSLDKDEIKHLSSTIIDAQIKMQNLSEDEAYSPDAPLPFVKKLSSSIKSKLDQIGLSLININLKENLAPAS